MTSIHGWLGALALAAILGTAHYLDYPNELDAAMATAEEAANAAHEQQARQRVARSAQRACGENAYFQILDTSTVQCFTKRGMRTHKVAL